jgi:hypothetical protein
MALSASPSLAADCTQPASPSPITVNGAATVITCTNTVPRTATVAGDNAIGITTTGDGNTVEITNSGQLTTQPGSLIPGGSYSQSTGARGIFAGTNGIGADITIENTGDINSFSDSIKAVDAATIGTIFSDNTHITITNSGNLTAGPNAEGIFARATYGSGNVVTIDNSGSIQTGYSASLSGTSSGIFADVDGNNGLVDITNNGAVNTTGLSAAGISGIASYYNGSGSGVVINNKQNGVITTTGIDAYGIFAQAGSVPSSVGHVNDGGTITVQRRDDQRRLYRYRRLHQRRRRRHHHHQQCLHHLRNGGRHQRQRHHVGCLRRRLDHQHHQQRRHRHHRRRREFHRH